MHTGTIMQLPTQQQLSTHRNSTSEIMQYKECKSRLSQHCKKLIVQNTMPKNVQLVQQKDLNKAILNMYFIILFYEK